MLAVNGLAGQSACYQLWVDDSGTNYDLKQVLQTRWDYVDEQCRWFAFRYKPPGPVEHRYERVYATLRPQITLGYGWFCTLPLVGGTPDPAAAWKHVTCAATGSSTAIGESAPNTKGTRKSPDLIRVNRDAMENLFGQDATAWANTLLHEIGHSAGLEHSDDTNRLTVIRTPSTQEGDATTWISLSDIAWGPWNAARTSLAPSTWALIFKMKKHCEIK